MKFDVVFAGVGGQGVITICAVVARAAVKSGYKVLQTESHGMSQRGGAVISHLRMADREIYSPLISKGQADLLLGLELLEALRLLSYLSPEGSLVTAKTTIRSVDNYPEEARIIEALSQVPKAAVIDIKAIGKMNRVLQSINMILLGAVSKILPIEKCELEEAIETTFHSKGNRVVKNGLNAFKKGTECYSTCEFVALLGSGADEVFFEMKKSTIQESRVDLDALKVILDGLSDKQQYVLGGTGYRVLNAVGIQTPVNYSCLNDSGLEDLELDRFKGDQVFLKAISEQILHKASSGAMKLVEKSEKAVEQGIRDLRNALTEPVTEILIEELVPHREGLGSEIIVGVRWTQEFGPVIVFGPGGLQAEILNQALDSRFSSRILIPQFLPDSESQLLDYLGESSSIWFDRYPDRFPLISSLLELLRSMAQIGIELMPDRITELEINPLVFFDKIPMALDVLIKRNSGESSVISHRPLARINNLLHPGTIAIAGVSRSWNPGRIILQNTLQAGFNPDDLYLIKPGMASLEGIRCFPEVAELPAVVDLLVLAVSARQSAHLVRETVHCQKARSMILVSGGFDESGDKKGAAEILDRSIQDFGSMEQRPVINGPNCLGIRSLPGRYDSLFIPPDKLPPPTDHETPMAFISQSGAMIASRLSCLHEINPRYLISVGNQVDLTIGDYLEFFKARDEIEFFAVYVEGFTSLDGLRFIEAAMDLYAAGKRIIFYRAGRTEAGETAARSHTAAVGGDYAAAIALAEQAGMVVARSLDEFQDLIRLFAAFRLKKIRGNRLAGISNAGFECVAFADSVQDLQLARFSERTDRALGLILEKAGVQDIVDILNPLDLTPMSDDETFGEALKILLEDDQVDAVVLGCVPLSPALETLAGISTPETAFGPETIAGRLVGISENSSKPFVVVIDGGELYEPLVFYFRKNGIPVFRRMDYAVSLFEKYLTAFEEGKGRSKG